MKTLLRSVVLQRRSSRRAPPLPFSSVRPRRPPGPPAAVRPGRRLPGGLPRWRRNAAGPPQGSRSCHRVSPSRRRVSPSAQASTAAAGRPFVWPVLPGARKDFRAAPMGAPQIHPGCPVRWPSTRLRQGRCAAERRVRPRRTIGRGRQTPQDLRGNMGGGNQSRGFRTTLQKWQRRGPGPFGGRRWSGVPRRLCRKRQRRGPGAAESGRAGRTVFALAQASRSSGGRCRVRSRLYQQR